jgi:hypothetical protein
LAVVFFAYPCEEDIMIRITAAVLIALSLVAPVVHAQDVAAPAPAPAATPIRASIEKVRFDREGRDDRDQVGAPQRSPDHSVPTKSAPALRWASWGCGAPRWSACR